jgi:hypothetical protein
LGVDGEGGAHVDSTAHRAASATARMGFMRFPEMPLERVNGTSGPSMRGAGRFGRQDAPDHQGDDSF